MDNEKFDISKLKISEETQKIIKENFTKIMNKPEYTQQELVKPVALHNRKIEKILEDSNKIKSRNELTTRIATILAAIFGFVSIILAVVQIYLIFNPPN